MIQRILHFIWFGSQMPRWVRANIDRWQELNPDWVVMVHGGDCMSPMYKPILDHIEDRCSRSDLLRLSVLRTFGGWYFDCDFIPFKPLDDLYEKYDIDDVFLTQQWGKGGPKWVANGIFAISTNSRAWSEIDDMVEQAKDKPLERTSFGPLLTTQLAVKLEIPCSPPKEFYPWRPPATKCVEKCAEVWGKKFSEEALAASRAENSTAAHLWMGGDYNQPLLDRLT